MKTILNFISFTALAYFHGGFLMGLGITVGNNSFILCFLYII